MVARLSTHVLDTVRGRAATGIGIDLYRIAEEQRELVVSMTTNADGRTEIPLLANDEMECGRYEIIFFLGDYFAAKSPTLPKIRFLDKVPVRIGIADAGASYHVPLLCTPWSYSTYRGS